MQEQRPSVKSSCQATYVVDGDTVHLACADLGKVKARLLGFDTPEVYSPRCSRELAAGEAATRVLGGLLRQGPITAADFRGYDSYGRDLVRLDVAGQDVARAMIASGYALPYSGGRRPDWCSIL